MPLDLINYRITLDGRTFQYLKNFHTLGTVLSLDLARCKPTQLRCPATFVLYYVVKKVPALVTVLLISRPLAILFTIVRHLPNESFRLTQQGAEDLGARSCTTTIGFACDRKFCYEDYSSVAGENNRLEQFPERRPALIRFFFMESHLDDCWVMKVCIDGSRRMNVTLSKFHSASVLILLDLTLPN